MISLCLKPMVLKDREQRNKMLRLMLHPFPLKCSVSHQNVEAVVPVILVKPIDTLLLSFVNILPPGNNPRQWPCQGNPINSLYRSNSEIEVQKQRIYKNTFRSYLGRTAKRFLITLQMKWLQRTRKHQAKIKRSYLKGKTSLGRKGKNCLYCP